MLLNCHSWFSLTYGVMSPEQLLQEAQAQGITSMALTDINCTAGLSDFFRLASTYKVRPIVGIEFRRAARLLYIGIAQSNEGLHHLHSLLTMHLLHSEPLPSRAPELPEAYIIYPYTSKPPADLRPNEYIGVRHADLNRMRFTPLARRTEKLLALASVTFRNKQDHNVHRLLRAVDTNTLLGQTPPEHVAPAHERFVNEEEFCAQFAVAPELVQNTRRLMDQCEVHFGFGQPKNLRCWSGNPEEDRRLLLEETQRGLVHRYGANNAVATARLEKELAVVQQKDFVSYFLINWDLIRFAKHKGFFHVGRGSGANSIAAYCLGITDVDPIELDLYFERFINPSRSSPPDFDLDFSWKDRDQVQQYLFDKYGKDNRVALLGTYNTFQSRAVVRELGKVFGLPPAEIDALADPRLTTRLSKLDKVAQTIVKYSPLLIDMPRHIKAHYPIEFMVAVANNFGGFYHTEFYLNEARHAGACIHPPCVNLSDEWCTLHNGTDIYLGLQMVRSLTEETVAHLLTSRHRNGPFTSFLELLERVPIHQEQVRLLIRSGALRFTSASKQALYWQLLMFQRGQKNIHDADLFRPPVKTFELPKLESFANADAWDEYELIGYPLTDPYNLPHELPGDTILAREMRMHIGRRVRMLGYVVHVKPSTTKTGERMEFGCYMDKEGRLWDGIHFPDVAMRYPILGRGIYLLTGKIEEEFGHHALTVERAEKVGYRADPRYAA